MNQQEEFDKNSIILILKILKKYWLWFIFSTIVCCGIAVLYIMKTPKSFKRTASVMIREETPMSDVQAAFSDWRYPGPATINVHNEIEAFKAPHLMYEVISRLNLTTNYFRLDGLRKYDLYGQTPFRALFLDTNENSAFSFQIETLSDKLLMLSNFEMDKVKYEINMEVQMNDTIFTPGGRMIITPTIFYLHNQSGTFQIVKYSSLNLLNIYTNKYKYQVELSNKLNNIIILNFEDVSVQRADDVLNTMIDVYNENWLGEKNTVAIIAKKFFDDRIPLIEMELKEIEDQLEKYKTSHLLTDVRQASNLYMRESADYMGKIVEIRNQISVAGYILDYMKNNENLNSLLPSANIGLANSSIELQISQYNTTMSKRNELIVNSGGRNPTILDINTSLDALRKSIFESMENHLAGLQLQLNGLQDQESKMSQNIASNPVQERHLATIEREHQLKQSLYLHLLQKREENDMTLVMATMNTRIISPPSGALVPVRPKEKQIFLIALFFGICIPGGIIWGKEILNDTIRDKNELDGLSVPLLGVIPEAKSTEMKKFLLVHKYGAGPINESFRFLRTRIGRICTNDTKVIQITSMEPGSGKTFIAVNLAMCFALAGKKVALLDLDFRKATLSRLINSPEFGMYHLLSGLVLHERYFIEKNYFYNGFDILPTGPLPVDPSELLLSDNLEKLIKRFKTTYDYIFVDCPPVNLVTDAEIFAALADFSIFVIRENHTSRKKLDEIKKIKQEEQFKNMHIVLNGSVADIQPDIYYDLYNKSIHALPKATEVWKSSGYLTEGTNR